MFTEEGLYNIMTKSRTVVGRKFRKFITVVIQELRLHGHVTLTDALGKLQTELASKDKYINVLDKECEDLKEKSDMLSEDLEELREKLNRERQQARHLSKDKQRLEKQNATISMQNHKSYEATSREGRLWAKAKKYLTPLYFVHVDAEDDTVPANDDDAVWKLVKSQPANEDHSFTVHVFRDTSLTHIHEVFISQKYGVKTKSGGWSANKYHGSLDSISNLVESILLGEEKNTPWPSCFDDSD